MFVVVSLTLGAWAILCLLAFKVGVCKWGWHPRPYETLFNDGCSDHSRCRKCGFEGLVDSQGNLF